MNRSISVWLASAVGIVSIAFLFHANAKSFATEAGDVQAAEAGESKAAKGFLLEEEPEDAQDVITVRQKSKNGDDVVVVGRIGGRKSPWVKGAAAFSIVDASAKACSEIPGDRCPTPWDFCCEADLPKKTVLVSFVDEAGKIVKKDARELLKVKELRTVVIQGKVKRDKVGNVSVLAAKIFVREDKPEGKPVVK